MTYDMLTLDQLLDLHSRLSDEHHANHVRMIDPVTRKPRISIYSDEWNVLSAKGTELWEAAESAYAEIQRRMVAETWDVARPAMQARLNDA